MKSILLLAVFAVLVIVSISTSDAYAASYTLDSSSCASPLGGTWNGGTNTCQVSGVTNLYDTIFIPQGDTLVVTTQYGFIFDYGMVTNNGTMNFVNQGAFGVINGGVLNNNGVITVNPLTSGAGGLQNGAGTINNNAGGVINNNGKITNYYAIINNRGTLNAGSDLENQAGGTINNICPGAITGTIIGRPVVNSCPQTTTTTVSSSQNPSGVGQSVTFTATISPNTATGTVQFKTDGTNLGSPVTVSSGTAASVGISSLAAGPHTITAIYSGDGNSETSTGTLTQTVNSLTCPAGQYLSGSSCVPAPPGSYVPTAGSTSATLCPVGTYQPNAGQTSCIPSPAGSFVQSTGSTSASQCVAGSFQPNTGSASCNPANPGNYASGPGSTSETQCLAGTYQPNSGAASCIPAPEGSFVAGTGATSSTLCPIGTFTSTEGQSVCTPAPAGSYVNTSGAMSSNLCPAGNFTSTSGQSSCTPSPAGSFVGSTGSTSSTLCAPGSYQPNAGQTSCTLASPGFFVGTSGATQQMQCPFGTTSDVAGSTSCHAASTAGKVTGGGSIGKDLDFGFEVHSKDGKTFKGHLEYHEKTSDIDLDGNTITQLFVDSTMTHAIFAGQATQDNNHHDDKQSVHETLSFLVNVTDPDKKGDRDTFAITVTNSTGNVVYQKSGTVQGHIEIHNVDDDRDHGNNDNGGHGDNDDNHK